MKIALQILDPNLLLRIGLLNFRPVREFLGIQLSHLRVHRCNPILNGGQILTCFDRLLFNDNPSGEQLFLRGDLLLGQISLFPKMPDFTFGIGALALNRGRGQFCFLLTRCV